MRLRFVFSEIGIGLRRNLSMTISVILVTFVSEKAFAALTRWASRGMATAGGAAA